MRKVLVIGAVLGLLSNLTFASTAHCLKSYQDHVQTDMKLSQKDFDGNFNGGFRTLAHEGCELEAAILIDDYMKFNKTDDSMLHWHAAQLRAIAEDVDGAVKHAKLSLYDNPDPVRTGRWNDYVLATVAFLQRDRETLVYHRNKLAEVKDMFWGNALNLKLIDALIQNYDKSYRYVIEHVNDDS